jgi:Domain of unknown function (DUF4411)
MGRYWLDSDVMMQASNGLYSFSIAKQFWDWLEEQARKKTLCSSVRVYKEIRQYGDDSDSLVRWAASMRRNSEFFCDTDPDIQVTMGKVGDYVVENYDERRAAVGRFLNGADPWIIAHAKCDGGIVVTQECRVDKTAKVPKIPNVCHAVGVGCIDLPQMLSRLKFRFGK